MILLIEIAIFLVVAISLFALIIRKRSAPECPICSPGEPCMTHARPVLHQPPKPWPDPRPPIREGKIMKGGIDNSPPTPPPPPPKGDRPIRGGRISAFEAMHEEAHQKYPRKPDGSLDWEKMIPVGGGGSVVAPPVDRAKIEELTKRIEELERAQRSGLVLDQISKIGMVKKPIPVPLAGKSILK